MPAPELAIRIQNKMKMAAAAGITPDELWNAHLTSRPNPESPIKPIDVLRAVGVPITYTEYYIAVKDKAKGHHGSMPIEVYRGLCTDLAEGQITPVNRRPIERYRPDEVPQTPEAIEAEINSYIDSQRKDTYHLIDAAKVSKIPYHYDTIQRLKELASTMGIDTNGVKVPMTEPQFRTLATTLLDNQPKVEEDWYEKWMERNKGQKQFWLIDVYDATRRNDSVAMSHKIRELLEEIGCPSAHAKYVTMNEDEFNFVTHMIGVVSPYKSSYAGGYDTEWWGKKAQDELENPDTETAEQLTGPQIEEPEPEPLTVTEHTEGMIETLTVVKTEESQRDFLAPGVITSIDAIPHASPRAPRQPRTPNPKPTTTTTLPERPAVSIEETMFRVNEARYGRINAYANLLKRNLNVADLARVVGFEFNGQTSRTILDRATANGVNVEHVWTTLTPEQFKATAFDLMNDRYVNPEDSKKWIDANPKKYYSLTDVIIASGQKFNKVTGSATIRSIARRIGVDVSATQPRLSGSDVLFICAEIPKSFISIHSDRDNEAVDIIAGSSLIQKARREFTPDNHPSVWVRENPKNFYTTEDAIMAGGRKSKPDKDTIRRTQRIMMILGINPNRNLTAEEVIAVAEAYGAPGPGREKQAPDHERLLRELGIRVGEPLIDEKPEIAHISNPFERVAELLKIKELKTKRTGEKPKKEDSEEMLSVPKVLSTRQEAGLDLSEKLLSSILNQVVEDMTVEVERDPKKLLQDLELPNSYLAALNTLSTEESAQFIADVTRQTITSAWFNVDQSNGGRMITQKLSRYIQPLIRNGTKVGEILYFIHKYYGVEIPEYDHRFIQSDLLRDRSRARRRQPSHGFTKL